MSAITILEPLTIEEESERLRLERQVERAFYQAGLALKALRDQKLYRATHHNFRDYCKERFGFGKSAVYYLISAVDIVDNLKKCPPLVDTFPTSERQVRSLKQLEASQQRKAWAEAVEKAKGVPTAKIVEEVVNQLKDKSNYSNKDLEKQIMVDKNSKVSASSEGVNYVQGVGIEWYVRVDEETWIKLNRYAEKIGTATLGGAIKLLLESAPVKP